MVKQSEAAQRFIKRRMRAWKAGKMHSRLKKGPVVKSQEQALAIAPSWLFTNEAQKKKMKIGEPT